MHWADGAVYVAGCLVTAALGLAGLIVFGLAWRPAAKKPKPEDTLAALLLPDEFVDSERRYPWVVPRSAGKCRGKLQAARLRLLLSFLQHERLAEHCPGVLEESAVLEAIGGCFVADELLCEAFWAELQQTARAAGLHDREKLAAIRAAFTEPKDRRVLDLDVIGMRGIGDAGARMAGAALLTMDGPLPFEVIDLRRNEFTPVGMRSIVVGLGRGRLPNLKMVIVSQNRTLGDDGMAALVEALAECASLEVLRIEACGVRRAGFEAVAACVPNWPRLRWLDAGNNPGPSDALGRALAAALPSLPNAERFELRWSGLGGRAVAELQAAKAAAGTPDPALLRRGCVHIKPKGDTRVLRETPGAVSARTHLTAPNPPDYGHTRVLR